MPTFVRAYPPASAPDSPAILLPFHGDDIVVARQGEGLALLCAEDAPAPLQPPADALYLGMRDDRPCLAFSVTPHADDDAVDPLDEGALKATGLRHLFGALDDEDVALAGYAAQLVRWQRNSRFCPACGARAERHDGWGVRCVECGFAHYPPASPAVLLLIHDGADRVLLAQKPGWGKRYSILAGFVEPGESLEGCCRREGAEESGVQITDIRYFGSQAWPFPHQLMVAFFARWESGEIRPDETELSDARWFAVDDLPELPPPYSLSRQTIDAWIASRGPR